jgi:hypothetical protein
LEDQWSPEEYTFEEFFEIFKRQNDHYMMETLMEFKLYHDLKNELNRKRKRFYYYMTVSLEQAV